MKKTNVLDPELLPKERHMIHVWFNEEVEPEVPTAFIKDVVVFIDKKESYTSILCEYERPDQGISAYRLSGVAR